MGEGLEGFHQEAIEDDGQQWQELSVSGKFLWPGPKEKEGEAGIHAQMNDFVGMEEEFDIRKITWREKAEEGDEEKVKEEEDFFDHTGQNYDKIWLASPRDVK